nr:serine/threonine-protein kinase 40 isoform X2 [Parasteatoda tepidariorum]XP_042905484.1 serine/threonine-protein kinase 40 isoform X2 [Parasteatoda tepidariorum]
MLLHTEYSLLSILQFNPGVIHHHGLFKDEYFEPSDKKMNLRNSVRRRQRVCLVLDCLSRHEFNPRNSRIINLQHYVISEKKLSEKEAVFLFYDIVNIVSSLHKENVVHRDLKLGNIVLNQHTRKVTLTNFCLGKHLMNENDLLKDQRGSPAYISPDVLSGKPYLGKPSDMWALGVVLFTMLYGIFPFYDSVPQELFRKIKSVEFTIPGSDGRVSESSNMIIRNLLNANPTQRMTAEQVLDALSCIAATRWSSSSRDNDLQVVPVYVSPTTSQETTNKAEDKSISLQGAIEETSALDLRLNSSSVYLPIISSQKEFIRPKKKKSHQGFSFPICHINEDAQPLTQSDIQSLRHILPSTSHQ